jgi:hypothetical protein
MYSDGIGARGGEGRMPIVLGMVKAIAGRLFALSRLQEGGGEKMSIKELKNMEACMDHTSDFDEGYDEGFSAGYEDGLQVERDLQEDLITQLDKLKQEVKDLKKALHHLRGKLELERKA